MAHETDTDSQHDPYATSASNPMTEGLDNLELAKWIRSRCDDGLAYAAVKRPKWKRLAVATKLGSLTLSAAATITLGFAPITPWTSIGFVCSALVTTFGAIEPYFNLRSRWILAEKALHEWHRVREDLDLYVASADELDRETLIAFDRRRAETWTEFSEQWLEARRSPNHEMA